MFKSVDEPFPKKKASICTYLILPVSCLLSLLQKFPKKYRQVAFKLVFDIKKESSLISEVMRMAFGAKNPTLQVLSCLNFLKGGLKVLKLLKILIQ